MTVPAFILFAAAVAVMVGVHFYTQRRLEARIAARREEMDRLDNERQLALFKQQKASERTVHASDRAVRKLADQARHLHEDARLLHQRTDQFFSSNS